MNTEIAPDRSTFVFDNNDTIDDTHYILCRHYDSMSVYKSDGSRDSLYVIFFEMYTDSKRTNLLYYGLSLGDWSNRLQNILYANTTTGQEPSVANLTQ